MNKNLAENIYVKLGAEIIPNGEKITVPSVCDDGSCTPETKEWALQKLGFVSSGGIEFKGWIETERHSVVVPYGATIEGKEFFLGTANVPGSFTIEWGSLNTQKFFLPETFPADKISEAIEKVEKQRSQVKASLLELGLVVNFEDYAVDVEEDDDLYLYTRMSDRVKHRLHHLKLDKLIFVVNDGFNLPTILSQIYV